MSPRGSMVRELLSVELFFFTSLASFIAMAWRYKNYIAGRNNGLCMHNILRKKHGDLCDFCRREVIFKSSGKLLKTFRRVEIHFYYTCI